ncbi:hypothetical protein K1719_001785 [Acacia pycnantha]|nr:hypothetical protein K1719_001785 [Acacia pycnantha]
MATAMVEDSGFGDDQLASMTTDDVVRASRLLDNEIRLKVRSLSTNQDYNDIGGLEKQIQELVEAIVLPMTHKERFRS